MGSGSQLGRLSYHQERGIRSKRQILGGHDDENQKNIDDVAFNLVMYNLNALKMEFRKIKLPEHTEDCAVCGDHPTITELIDYEQTECEGI